jgi:hypothetical protein
MNHKRMVLVNARDIRKFHDVKIMIPRGMVPTMIHLSKRPRNTPGGGLSQLCQAG